MLQLRAIETIILLSTPREMRQPYFGAGSIKIMAIGIPKSKYATSLCNLLWQRNHNFLII